MLESVQKFGLKVCLKQWYSTYENLIDQAGIPSLAVRRKLLAFEHMAEMWFDQEKLNVRMTPRYLTAVTLFIFLDKEIVNRGLNNLVYGNVVSIYNHFSIIYHRL